MQNHEDSSVLERLYESGVIDEVHYRIKGGKEATVYCCTTGPNYGRCIASVKVYRPIEVRGFKRASVYDRGRVVLDKREGRAIKNKSNFGRMAQLGEWMNQEYEIMIGLFEAGADIPRPIRFEDRSIIMEHIGDMESPAPQLRKVRLETDEAVRLYERVMENILLFLSNNCVHGDLSPYNILYWEGKITIIDFPQCIDPRFNREAFDVLLRDMENVYSYFSKYGVEDDINKRARNMWWEFLNGRLK